MRLARQDVSTATGTLGKALLSKAAFKDQQVDSDDSDYEDTKKALKDSLMDAKLDKAQCSTALKHATQKLEELKKKAQELHEAALCKERKVAQVLSGKRKVRSSADAEEETSDVEDDDMLGGGQTMSEDSDRGADVNVDEEQEVEGADE